MLIKEMKKTVHLLLTLFLMLSASLKAQDFQGKAFYMSKTNVDMDFTKNIPPERRKFVIERIKQNMEKNYELDFNNSASMFYEEQRLDISGNGGRFNFMSFMSPIQGILYKDYATNTFTNRVELFGKFFLIKDSLPKNKWVMTGASKKIGAYTCYKATLTKEVPQQVFQFGRRSQNADENTPKMKEVNIDAWFTPQIPVATGPAKHGGLPGLILEISEGNTTILCTKVVINPKDKLKIKMPNKGTKVSVEEFEKIRTKKINEMREMFQKRRREGRGPIRRGN